MLASQPDFLKAVSILSFGKRKVGTRYLSLFLVEFPFNFKNYAVFWLFVAKLVEANIEGYSHTSSRMPRIPFAKVRI